MFYTGKQDRNGATGSTAQQVSAQPGPDATADIAAAVGMSTNAGNQRAAEAAVLIQLPAGNGFGDHIVGASGDIWEWDSGLPIKEMPGERA